MFVAQAHSFTQQARLAITLAWVAGFTNVVSILACGHVTSHVSGTTSDLGHHLIEALRVRGTPWSVVLFGLFLIFTFLVGAILSGFTTELGRRKNWESIYVLPMAVQAVLLAAFAIGLEATILSEPSSVPARPLLAGLASLAMGVQNATITRISSGVVRTTHVTGVVTDLGLELVQFLWAVKDEHKHAPARHAVPVPHDMPVAHTSRWFHLSPTAPDPNQSRRHFAEPLPHRLRQRPRSLPR